MAFIHGKIEFSSSDDQFISAIVSDDFIRAIDETMTLNSEMTIDKSFISALSPNADKYDFVKVADSAGNEIAIVPNVDNLADAPKVGAGTYTFTLFNLLDSMDCERNNYPDKKDVMTVEFTPMHKMTDIYVSSFISGDPNRFYDCTISENGYSVAEGLGDTLQWTFNSDTNYKLVFKPISKKNNSVNTCVDFIIGQSLALNDSNPYAIAINNLSLGQGLQILDAYGIFEVGNGSTIVRRFSYAPAFDEFNSWKWVSVELPVMVRKLLAIKVVFAFKEN